MRRSLRAGALGSGIPEERLELIGAKAGRVRRRLVGAVGSVSLSPNGRQIYAERTNGHLDPFPIDRIPATGGPIQRVATGQQPAVSPDGTRLAMRPATATP